MAALDEAAAAVRAIGRQGQSAVAPLDRRGGARMLYPLDDPVAGLTESEKVALFDAARAKARASDPRVAQVMASLAGEHETVLVARSDGLIVADVRPLVRISITVIVEDDGRREQGYAGGGGRFGYSYFDDARLDDIRPPGGGPGAHQSARTPGPRGTMTVVLGNGWPGILLHEAIGHGLEGDFNRKETSAFSGRVGQRVAAPGSRWSTTARSIAGRGSLNLDDEGNPTQRTGADRGRHPARLHAGSSQRTADERGADRQRPARIVRAPADAAHDQHADAGGRSRSGRDHRVGEERPLRGQFRRRAGRHHQRQVRVLGGRGVA